MRCKHCGGEITLETRYCPNCGQPNEHALEHVQNMEEFRYEFEDTKSDVEEVTHRYTGVTVRAIACAILFILMVILLIAGGKSYEFRSSWMEMQAEKNAVQYMKEMDEMLMEEEFLAFQAFCQEKYIRTYDTVYEKYTPVERAVMYYQFVYHEMMRIVSPPVYMEDDFTGDYIAEYLDGFYDALNMENYEYYEGVDNEINRNALAAMEENIHLMLQTYCGIDQEMADQFPTMSQGQKAVAIEEALSHE